MISNNRLETVRETDTHYFFWKSAFSQWSMRDFRREGITYCCAEQYMMAEKARLFGDDDVLQKIMASNNPAVHKKLGRQVKNYDDAKWCAVSRYVVFIANMAKFLQHKDLRDKLLATGNKIIVEASPYDALWGVALGPWDDNILDEKNWKGKNWLGKELRAVREQIRYMS